ncbi:MAG: phosphate transporter, phosphate-binding protein [Bacteroidetes bacterium]|jgi:phosphate transport system substrate-binding protein|nr:phosphate transporter, phosphate-binding protein [Bacteroidota bacterium]
MKRIVLFMSLMVVAFGSAMAQKVKGSDTCLPLVQKEAEVYMKEGKGKLTVTGGGSGIGFAALIEGSTDIAMASRAIKFDEKMKMQNGGRTAKQVVIARDALSIVVNPSNKVTNLTREQLEGIFTGKITNWKQVGGADLAIVAYSRETTSGTYEFFKEHVMKNKNYKSGILSMPATGAIIQSVSQTKGAIGYVGMAYVTKDVKEIHVSYDAGKTYVEPTVANAKAGKYPIVRPLYLYYEVKSEKKVKPFIDFVLSAQGQKIVDQVGYLALK